MYAVRSMSASAVALLAAGRQLAASLLSGLVLSSLLYALPAQGGEDEAVPAWSDELGLSGDAAGLAMIGGYLGMSEFCRAYGVDFSPMATGMIVKLKSRLSEQPKLWLIFTQAVNAGSFGTMYSMEVDRFIEMVPSGADPKQLCYQTYQGVIALSKLK